MRLEVGKTYSTRSYGTVRIIATDASRPQPVVGLHDGMPITFTADGKFYGDSNESGLDLVSEYVEPPKPREAWIYIHQDGDYGSAYTSTDVGSSEHSARLVKFREVIE